MTVPETLISEDAASEMMEPARADEPIETREVPASEPSWITPALVVPSILTVFA